MSLSALVIELPVNINYNEHLFLSPRRIRLLRLIEQTGSINAAARMMSISYQNTWNIISEMNKISPVPVIILQRGGKGGGGAKISEYGKLLLKEYACIENQVDIFLKKLNFEINQ
jgi:molybdate transport system regulatory protein